MTKLHLAAGLELPLDVVTQKLAFLGRTGSGKTYGATKLAELMLEHGAQLVALDPVGKWYGLRLGADKKSEGFKIPVLGGLYGDLPLEPTAGALVADLVVDRGISAVLDVSQFETDAQKARFAEAFAIRFFFRKKAAPTAVHLFLEECQEFVPQNPQGGEQDMLHAFTRMAKLGRNFGIGVSLISQRPQEVNKKVLNMTEVMFAFQMRGPQERKTIKDWSSDKDLEHDIVEDLPSLAVGECFVSSPQWLQVERKIRIAKKHTADVSSTPTVGAAAGPAKPLTPIDLVQLRDTMAATIEKAKAEDPKELHKRIRGLESELTQARKANGRPDPAAVQQLVDAAVTRSSRVLWQQLERWRGPLRLQIHRARDAVSSAAESLGNLAAAFDEPLSPAPGETLGARPSSAALAADIAAAPSFSVAPGRSRRRASPDVAPAEGLSRPQQRMLNALATMRELTRGEMQRVPRNVVAALSGQSPRSSGWDKNLSTLRTKGLIAYPDADTMELTRQGERVSEPDVTITSLADLHAAWRDLVSRPQWRMIEALIAVYPDAMERNALAAQSHQSPASSGWDKNLSTLRSLGVIDYPSSTEAVATELLFPRGLAR